MGMKERAREKWKLQEVGGQRGWVTTTMRVREETSRSGNEEKRTGAVFTKGHVGRSPLF